MAIISRCEASARTVPHHRLPGLICTADAEPPLDQWEFTLDDESGALRRCDWKSFRDSRAEVFTVDLPCVTRWSKLGTSWEGVSLDTVLAGITTDASYALVRSYGDYTTNRPLPDLLNRRAWIAFRFSDEELSPEHGGPARLRVPRLYLWKRAKWVRGGECSAALVPTWHDILYVRRHITTSGLSQAEQTTHHRRTICSIKKFSPRKLRRIGFLSRVRAT